MQIRYDRRSGSCNLRLQMNPKKQKTNSGLQRTHGLCVSAAVFDHLSYEDPYIWSRLICWVHLNLWKEWNMKIMWTAEVQILNEDMIVTVVVAIQTIANKLEKKTFFLG